MHLNMGINTVTNGTKKRDEMMLELFRIVKENMESRIDMINQYGRLMEKINKMKSSTKKKKSRNS